MEIISTNATYLDTSFIISANPQSLREDVRHEAEIRNRINPTTERLISNLFVTFSPETFTQYKIDILEGERHLTLQEKYDLHTAKKEREQQPRYRGGSFFRNRNSPAILISPNVILESLSIRGDMNASALKDEVNSIWRHEREHMMLSFHPFLKYLINLEAAAYAGAVLLPFDLYAGYVGYRFVEEFDGMSPEKLLKFTIASASGLLIYASAHKAMPSNSAAYQYWYHHISIEERLARRAGKDGSNLPNLFEVEKI
jgi:hypothetical protein